MNTFFGARGEVTHSDFGPQTKHFSLSTTIDLPFRHSPTSRRLKYIMSNQKTE